MTKNEFFTSLNSKLSVLNEKERKDITDEYVSHVDLKIRDGKTEEQAVADFGDIDDLAREILEAYHIDNTISQTKTLEYYFKAGVNFINQATENLLNFSPSAIAKTIVEFFLVILAIYFISWPINMLSNSITFYMSLPFLTPFAAILKAVIELVKISIGFLIIYSFIKTRILSKGPNINNTNDNFYSQNNQNPNASSEVIQNSDQEASTIDKADSTVDMEKIEVEKVGAENIEINYSDKNGTYSQSYSAKENDYARSYSTGGNTYTQSYSNGKKQSNLKNANEYQERKHFNGGDFVTNLVVNVLKITLFFVAWLPVALTTITGIVCTVLVCILFAAKGIGFLGICVIGVGCSIMGISFTAWLGEVIFGGKNKNA